MPSEHMPGGAPRNEPGSYRGSASTQSTRTDHDSARQTLPLYQSLSAIVTELEGLSVTDVKRPAAHFQRICELDDYVRAITDAALVASTSSILQPRHYRDPAVFVARDVFGSVLDAYLTCRSEMLAGNQMLVARIVRAAAERVKWEQFAGGPAYEGLWQSVGQALSIGVCPTSAGDDAILHEGTVEQECLRALAYFSAGYEQLAPDLFGIVNGLVDLALPRLGLYKKAVSGTVYYVDLERGTAPVRFVQVPEPGEGLRYFATRPAHDFLQGLDMALKRGELPRELDLIPAGRDQLIAGLGHLMLHWSPTPPARRNRRHLVDGALHAVQGYNRIHALLVNDELSDPLHLLFVDVSRGGVGVLMESGVTPAIGIGALVAIRPLEGGVWHLEMVQRAWQESDMRMMLGLMTLSVAPAVVDVIAGAQKQSVLLCDPFLRGEAVRIVAPHHGDALDDTLHVIQGGGGHELRRLGPCIAGADFDLWAYQVQ